MDKYNILKNIFNFESFKNGQDEIIDNILNFENKGILVVMPTGGGKSLLYQIPSILSNELSIVISPLISLMQDQVNFLKSKNVNCEFYNSTLSNNEKIIIQQKIYNKQLNLLYIAPEDFPILIL